MLREKPYTLNPGRLRHSVDIESPPSTEDATGAAYGAWTVYASSVAAEIISGGGSEQLGGDAFLAQSTYRITIRWIDGITTAMRINWGGRLFNIANTNDIEGRNRVLELTCTEGLSHGN